MLHNNKPCPKHCVGLRLIELVDTLTGVGSLHAKVVLNFQFHRSRCAGRKADQFRIQFYQNGV